MSEVLIPIPGRLHSVATEGHVAGADEIYDDDLNKLQSTINSDVNNSLSNLGSSISDEVQRAQTAEQANADAIGAIEEKIPSEASSSNQLADKAHVADSIEHITYNSGTGKLQKTVGDTTTDITTIVQSGFVPTYNTSTGITTMTPVGGATIAANTSTGIISMTF